MVLWLRLWVQGDNACKELRNSYTGRWASLLCQSNYFMGVAHHHMMVGHTHEDIGAGVCPKLVCLFPQWTCVSVLFMRMLHSCFSHRSPWDGIFSIVTSALNSEQNLQTPRDVQRMLRQNIFFVKLIHRFFPYLLPQFMQDFGEAHGPALCKVWHGVRVWDRWFRSLSQSLFYGFCFYCLIMGLGFIGWGVAMNDISHWHC